MPVHHDLAVVGGGSVGVSFLYQFLLALGKHASGLRVVIFEPRDAPGPGEAYQADSATNLLNIPAGNMSGVACDRGHFISWLHRQDAAMLHAYGVTALDPTDFLPRPLFGLYLRALYADALALAQASGVQVLHVQARVTKVALPHAHPVVVHTEHAEHLAEYVVLCNGNLASRAFDNLQGTRGYFNSPYPVQSLIDTIPRHASVGILGTSLSAVDAISALAKNGHTGSILAVSRNGRLPAVRSPHNTAPTALKYVSRAQIAKLASQAGGTLGIDTLRQSLLDELALIEPAMDLADILGNMDDPRQALDAEVARSSAGPRPWQAIAAATNPAIDLMWQTLSQADKQRFQQELRSHWMARRAMFPMQNALILQQLMHAGTLTVRGHFAHCIFEAEADARPYKIHFNSGALRECAPCSHIINATSFSVDIVQTQDELVRQLLNDGYARANAFGGFELDFESGCLVSAGGKIQNRVSVLGSLAGGTYFWTVSMDVNARLARDQATRIAAALLPADRAMSLASKQ